MTSAETAASQPTTLARQVIVLASASPTRAAMLERAGLAVEVDAPRVDEDEIKRSMRGEGFDAAAVAEALAEQKARSVARSMSGVRECRCLRIAVRFSALGSRARVSMIRASSERCRYVASPMYVRSTVSRSG